MVGRTDFDRLVETARRLRPRPAARKPLPALLFVTDPQRTPDPEVVARRLPRGCGVVFRAFGATDAPERARRLAKIRGLVLLVGADEALAASAGAHGLHLPEAMVGKLPRLKARHPGWIVTTAAHSPMAARRAARLGADAILYSTVFESRSASAGKPIGPLRLALVVKGLSAPVYALGGVNAQTAPRLRGVGLVGIAAVEGLRT